MIQLVGWTHRIAIAEIRVRCDRGEELIAGEVANQCDSEIGNSKQSVVPPELGCFSGITLQQAAKLLTAPDVVQTNRFVFGNMLASLFLRRSLDHLVVQALVRSLQVLADRMFLPMQPAEKLQDVSIRRVRCPTHRPLIRFAPQRWNCWRDISMTFPWFRMVESAISEMQESGCDSLPVLRESRVIGMIDMENIGELMMIRNASTKLQLDNRILPRVRAGQVATAASPNP